MKQTVDTPSIPEPSMRIVKIGSCPTLSNNGSMLQYHIACTEDGEIHLRIYANSSAGIFSNEWLAIKSIFAVTQDVPLDRGITSFIWNTLFAKSRSVNSRAFLTAILKAEGLLTPMVDNERCYLRCDPNEFMFNINALIQSGVDLKVDGMSSKPAPAKNEVSSKKTGKKKPSPVL